MIAEKRNLLSFFLYARKKLTSNFILATTHQTVGLCIAWSRLALAVAVLPGIPAADLPVNDSSTELRCAHWCRGKALVCGIRRLPS